MSRALKFDVIVIGAGGAGLMAARYAAQNPNVSVAVLSKLYPTRSHTGTAQGGGGRRSATSARTGPSGTPSTPSRGATT